MTLNIKRLLALIELTRPTNGLIVILSVVIAAILCGAKAADAGQIFLASFAAALIAAGGYAINDYFDLEINKINKPDRPLPRGVLSPQQALGSWMATSLAGLFLASFLPFIAFTIAISAVIALLLYSYKLKGTILLGNILVASLTGLTFVYGGTVAGRVYQSVFPALFAFLINLIREILKDLEDVEGDALQGAVTLPVKHGTPLALAIVTLLAATFIISTIMAYAVQIYNAFYLAIVAVIDVCLIVLTIIIWKYPTRPNFSKFSDILKWLMVAGLVAIYVGRFGR